MTDQQHRMIELAWWKSLSDYFIKGRIHNSICVYGGCSNVYKNLLDKLAEQVSIPTHIVYYKSSSDSTGNTHYLTWSFPEVFK